MAGKGQVRCFYDRRQQPRVQAGARQQAADAPALNALPEARLWAELLHWCLLCRLPKAALPPPLQLAPGPHLVVRLLWQLNSRLRLSFLLPVQLLRRPEDVRSGTRAATSGDR